MDAESLTWKEVMDVPPFPRQYQPGFTTQHIRLGNDTVNSCNPGIGDTDGDGLDEVVVPVSEGSRDTVLCLKGDGTECWRNEDVRFYRTDSRDPGGRCYPYKHRHLFTEVFDIDGDGRKEVILGDQVIYVLKGMTGRIQGQINTKGFIQAWCSARLFGADKPPAVIAGVERGTSHGTLLIINGALGIVKEIEMPGKNFYDGIWAGDINGDGRDEIAVSLESIQQLFLMDADGRVLWEKNIPKELGDDTHIDSLVIDSILPGDENQVLVATGPTLIDKDGRILWNLNGKIDHGQKIITEQFFPAQDGKSVYIVESFNSRVHLFSPEGTPHWTFANFAKAKEQYVVRDGRWRKGIFSRLTTAASTVRWTDLRQKDIAQAGIVAWIEGAPKVDGPLSLFITIIDSSGTEIARLPYTDVAYPAPFVGNAWSGAMCCLAAHMTPGPFDDLVLIPHKASEVLIFSRTEQSKR